MERSALEKLSSNKSLIIKPVDKGGAMVTMDKTDYMSEIHRQLSDTEVYEVITHNLTNTIADKILSILDHHAQHGTIDKKLRDYLIKSEPIIPIFYILPKIHKSLQKNRIPHSLITDSILSPLAITLEKILTPLVKPTKSFLLDTNEFI
ncbi:unnamed protein product, partial [Ranitomeya imitator]